MPLKKGCRLPQVQVRLPARVVRMLSSMGRAESSRAGAPYGWAAGRSSSGGLRTTSTEQGAARTVASATLPSSSRW